MTQPQPTTESLAPAPLPASHILSYVTTISTPTRVRTVASGSLFIVAGLNLIITLILLIPCSMWVIEAARNAAGGRGIELADVETGLGVVWRSSGDVFLCGLLCFVPCMVQFICIGPVKRGRKIASIFSMASIIPLGLIFMLLTAMLFAFGVFAGFGWDMEKAQPLALLTILPALAGLLMIMLLKDLCAFLLWIARNPITEKPPIPFLPRGPRQ